ncbi:MAG: hypothetical protein P4M12_07475 [Gammaproteobacteria bacterium]|nr:hypothetical protein [Gammaproteobacteria bacterium]
MFTNRFQPELDSIVLETKVTSDNIRAQANFLLADLERVVDGITDCNLKIKNVFACIGKDDNNLKSNVISLQSSFKNVCEAWRTQKSRFVMPSLEPMNQLKAKYEKLLAENNIRPSDGELYTRSQSLPKKFNEYMDGINVALEPVTTAHTNIPLRLDEINMVIKKICVDLGKMGLKQEVIPLAQLVKQYQAVKSMPAAVANQPAQPQASVSSSSAQVAPHNANANASSGRLFEPARAQPSYQSQQESVKSNKDDQQKEVHDHKKGGCGPGCSVM